MPQFIMIDLFIALTFSCSKCMKIRAWASVYSGERFVRYYITLLLCGTNNADFTMSSFSAHYACQESLNGRLYSFE